MHPIKTNRARRPLSPELAAAIKPAKDAAARLKRAIGRFAIYEFLETVYRIYVVWKRRKIAKRSARTLARELNIVRRKGMSPIRVLIEATYSNADFTKKSRWVRALEYAAHEGVPAKRLGKFIRAGGGLAGCARMAVNANRKRRRPGGDWND
jgi:hypothetical protein